jgi:hypothetical protein
MKTYRHRNDENVSDLWISVLANELRRYSNVSMNVFVIERLREHTFVTIAVRHLNIHQH